MKLNTSSLENLYENYKDMDEDLILVDGTEKLCADLDVDPTDIVTLVLAYHLKCERMCEFNRQGWIEGWTELGYLSVLYLLLDAIHCRK
jgi:DCN1-like protein 1/2